MNGNAVAGGLSTGIVLSWFWQGYMVPRGNPEMPNEVAGVIILTGAALAHTVIEGLKALWNRKKTSDQATS